MQGINDLVTPFYFVFLSSHLAANQDGSRAEEGTSSSSSSSSAAAAASGSHERDLESLTPAQLEAIEADAYWCLSKLIDAIQDHYTDAQPGIQRMVYKLSHLVKRIDSPLHAHFEDQGLQFIQFAFRWMNCFLMRELSLDLILRVWDTYLAEHGASSDDGAMVGSGAGGVVGIIPGGGMMSSCGGGGLSSAGMMGNSGLQEDGFAVLHVHVRRAAVALLPGAAAQGIWRADHLPAAPAHARLVREGRRRAAGAGVCLQDALHARAPLWQRVTEVRVLATRGGGHDAEWMGEEERRPPLSRSVSLPPDASRRPLDRACWPRRLMEDHDAPRGIAVACARRGAAGRRPVDGAR